MWRFFSAEYAYCKEFVAFFNLKKRMSESHFQIFSGKTSQGIELELVITGNTPVKAAMAAGYVMSGAAVHEDDVCVCIEQGDNRENCGICAEIYDVYSDRYFYPDICPVHQFDEYSSSNVIFASWYESLTSFYMQHQLVFFRCSGAWTGKFCQFMDDFWRVYGTRHPFHHVYVERKLKDGYDVDAVVRRLNGSRLVWINHYKDIFNRKSQSLKYQKMSPALILAKKEGQLIYDGSRECQNFGNEHFYYTSCMMNCLFDCEYCYLQGMYPSADVVIFMNIEDIFDEVDRLLYEHEVYLCVSYDTDLIALEAITGYCRRWIEYARGKQGLTIEIRTKASIQDSFIQDLTKKECENIIFAFTLSTDMVQLLYEHNTPSVYARIESIFRTAERGLNVRVCFDPIMMLGDADENRKAYDDVIEKLFDRLGDCELYDVSLGEFRVPCDYLKRMRKRRNDSRLLAYPFQIVDGSACCGDEGIELADYVEQRLESHVTHEKIYRWR